MKIDITISHSFDDVGQFAKFAAAMQILAGNVPRPASFQPMPAPSANVTTVAEDDEPPVVEEAAPVQNAEPAPAPPAETKPKAKGGRPRGSKKKDAEEKAPELPIEEPAKTAQSEPETAKPEPAAPPAVSGFGIPVKAAEAPAPAPAPAAAPVDRKAYIEALTRLHMAPVKDGKTQGEALREFCEAFGVATPANIPEARYAEAIAFIDSKLGA